MERDSSRIYPFCNKLAEIWMNNCPDLRFSQIVYILATLEDDIFNVEDDEMAKIIKKRFRKDKSRMKFEVGDKVKVKKKYLTKKNLPKKVYDNAKGILKVIEVWSEEVKVELENGEYFILLNQELKSAFPWKKFKKGKFDVHCETEKEAMNFLSKAKEMGYIWIDGDKINVQDSEWENNNINTVYTGYDFSDFDSPFIAIGYGSLSSSYRTVEWSDYMNENEVR